MTHVRPLVLMAGDFAHRDFAPALQWLRANTRLVLAATPDEALSRLSQGLVPGVILHAQARPGQWPPGDIERLHAASPLSRLVALLGTWCEGELRTGHPCPGMIRVFWHQWQPQLIPALCGGRESLAATWRVPRTSSESERLAGRVLADWPPGQGLVAIHTRTRTMYQALRDVCRCAGYATAWLTPGAPPDLDGVRSVVWDGVACDDAQAREIGQLRSRFAPQRLLVLLDFVRIQDERRAREAGATGVLAKPLAAFDVLWHLKNA